MNQNFEQNNIDIRIPEPPEELKPKKRSKLPLIISLSAVGAVLIAVAVVAAMLFIPLYTTPHWENTFNAIFFDTSEMQAFAGSLSDGISAEINLGLDKELTGLLKDINFKLSVASKFAEDSESGSLTLSLEEGKNSLALSVIYDKDSAAIGVYGLNNGKAENDPVYVSVPRENICEEFKKSVFAPDSGSDFALEKEVFDEIAEALETFESLDGKQEKGNLEEPISKIAEQIASVIDPKTSLRFSDSEFALVSNVSVTLTKEDLVSIIDVIIEEAEANEEFEAVLNSTYFSVSADGTQISLVESLKEAKDELPEGEITFSYSVSGDYVRDIKYSFNSADDPEEDFDAVLEFIYGEISGFDLKITYGDGDDDSITYRKTDNDSELKTELCIISEVEELKTSVTLNKADGSLIILASSPDNPESVCEIRGTLKYDKDEAHISMSFTSIKVGSDEPIDSFTFGIELGSHLDEISMPEAVDLFAMTEENFEDILANLPKDTLAEMLKNCTGQDLGSYFSADGKLMLNAGQYADIATAYANAYSLYLSNAEIMRADAVYIPVPELGINLLLYYDEGQNMIFYNFAYNMTDELLKIYHPAVIDANGNFSAHDVVLRSDTDATCQEDGATIYGCSICDETVTVKKDKIFHTWEQNTLSFTADNGEKYSLRYSYCSACSFISNFEIVGELSASFIYNHDENTYTIESYNDMGRTLEKYYGIPEVFDDLMIFTDVKTAYLQNCISVRIPYGVQTVYSGRFMESENVQVLILPSTIKEIKEGAFSSYQKLHTIFYCGTESDWKNVELGDLGNIIDTVNIIFCPDGVTPDMIKNELFDEERINAAITAEKAKIEKSNAAAKEAAKVDGVTLLYSGKIENIFCDEVSGYIGIWHTVSDSESLITLYNSRTGSVEREIKAGGKIARLYIREGYVAYSLEGSLEVFVYEIATEKTVSFSAIRYYEFSEDSLSGLFIHSGKVYTATSVQHCYITYYDIATGEISRFQWTVSNPELYISHAQNKLISLCLEQSPEKVVIYDLLTNTQLCEFNLDRLAFDAVFVSDYIIDNRENIYDLSGNLLDSIPEALESPAAPHIRDTMTVEYFEGIYLSVDRSYNISSVLTSTASNTSVVLNLYAEVAIEMEGGFLVYTPGGYGLLFVKIN